MNPNTKELIFTETIASIFFCDCQYKKLNKALRLSSGVSGRRGGRFSAQGMG